MKKKKGIGVLLAGALAAGLLPVSVLADTGDLVRQKITDRWDNYMFLYPGEDGDPGYHLFPSSYDGEKYRLKEARQGEDDTARLSYDDRGNLVGLTFDSTLSTRVETWEYDSLGREVRSTDVLTIHGEDGDEEFWNSDTETVYDSQGRVDQETIRQDGGSAVRRYVYDGQGRVAEERIESEGAPGATVYTYEGEYLVRDVYEGDGVKVETGYTYNEAGLLSVRTSVRSDYAGDGRYAETESITESFAYDAAGRLVGRKNDVLRADRSREYAEEYQWRFDGAGRLVRQEQIWESQGEDTGSRDCTISYDASGRVASVLANDVTHTYFYDEAGNNTKIVIQGEGVDEFSVVFTYEPAGPADDPRPAGFADVPDDAYYAQPVAWAVSAGVTGGTTETTFSPDDPCTRAQVVTFLWRAMGMPRASDAASFADVEKGSYYEEAVAWAVENAITAGTSETAFRPDDPCTRAQVVTFLWRAMNGPARGSGGDLFTDVHEGSYYYMPVAWAVDTDVTAGTSGTEFSPDLTCTRGQVVTFLYRAMTRTGE